MALFQGTSNFQAKRAARHGRTKQYKESIENKKVNNNKQPETKDDNKVIKKFKIFGGKITHITHLMRMNFIITRL